jgi:hypothetical protein
MYSHDGAVIQGSSELFCSRIDIVQAAISSRAIAAGAA